MTSHTFRRSSCPSDARASTARIDGLIDRAEVEPTEEEGERLDLVVAPIADRLREELGDEQANTRRRLDAATMTEVDSTDPDDLPAPRRRGGRRGAVPRAQP